MKTDEKGNLYVSGPGGLWIISPDGKHLGTIIGPEHPHNWRGETARPSIFAPNRVYIAYA
jgi:sugar lactone lactonase YvrE